MYFCVVGGGGGGGGGVGGWGGRGFKEVFLNTFLLWSGNRVRACNHKLLGTGYTRIKPISIHLFSPGVTASHQLLYQFCPRKFFLKMLPVRPKSLSARTQQNRLVVAVSNAVILSLASSIEDTCIHPSYAIAPFEKPAKIFNH